jgi:hypothetical protein
MALIRLTFGLLLATFISGNALAANRGISNPALFPNRAVAQVGEPVDFSGPLISLNMDEGGWDCSGNGLHADTNGTAGAIEGVVTNGFKISSTEGNNFLVISNAPINMSVTQSCTMLIWFKPSAENNETPVDGHLIHLTDNCSFPQFMLTYNPESTPGGAVEASFLGTGLAHPDESLDTNTWVCAGVTWNHLTSELVVWRDGIPSEAAVISEPPGEGSFFNLSLGGSCTPFDSVVQIDEFKVWDRVLSSNTIAYIAGHPAETVIACEPPGSANLNSGLVAYYTMDEVSGDRLDSVGDNDLSDNNTVTSTAGKISNAADFEANNAEWLAAASDYADLDFNGHVAFSGSVWVKFEAHDVDRTVLSKNQQYRLRFETDIDSFQWTVWSDGSTSTTLDAALAVENETWYHVYFWHDPDADVIGMRINDTHEVTTAHTGGVNNSANLFEVGRNVTSAYWDGEIDELAFYSRLLSPGEVTALYNSGAGQRPSSIP